MQVSLNYLVSRRESELDIFINKVKCITHEDTLLLTELRDAQVAAFPEAYLQPSKGITYICPNIKQFKHFQIHKRCVMSNKKLIMILGTGLKTKKNKNNDDMELIKLLRRYLDNAEANLPKTQINKDDLDDDEQKKDNQSPSAQIQVNPVSHLEERVERRRRMTRKMNKRREKINLKKITTLPLTKPSLKVNLKSVRRKRNKVKPTKKREVTERVIWNFFKQSDFLPQNWCISDKDHFQQLAEEIVKGWIVSLREVRIFYEDGSFTFLGSKLMDSLSTIKIKRIISLLKDKDTATRAWRSVLAEWLIEREEIKKRDEAEAEERKMKYDEEIEMYIKRLEELKAKGMSRISKEGKFLNIKAGGFSRFRIDLLDSGYPKVARQKLVEALSGTTIIEELKILDHLKDLLREEADTKTIFT
ncbi:hypothetical protein AgCh_017240 [Apium graveolens]